MHSCTSMQSAIHEPCELVQYADDTFQFVSNECLNTAVSQLETNAANLVDYFERHNLVSLSFQYRSVL